ncbi:Crp/Fnr family transcriptional regulator [Flavihumibacter cheonanensis]|uniref:Crp/Fnr family transcriptional regulator n=1 Tax=Flavihumibacter cheonanensis TaxID=1442385 RepID=UPI001EF76101|nr:Crp/Fnr family transcriptional regulator [Flavihumibacter cheonanensis]MCG7751721.1 Crp/Fnr family transcriptional regulator [Flavihumibacter cheonanensis]
MENEQFIDYLLQYDMLTKQQIELIKSVLSFKSYKEGEYFLTAGAVSREIGFILSGVIRVCYYDHNGNEITRYFLDEQNFLVDLNSYNTGIPTTEYIQAVTDSQILILTKASMEVLSNTITRWDAIISKITVKALSDKVARVSIMMPQNATERYSYFLEKFPCIANRVPLQYIASYIGVTKSSLSRLRATLSKNRIRD